MVRKLTKTISVCLCLVMAVSFAGGIPVSAYSVSTNGTTTADISMTYMLPNGSTGVFNNAFISKNASL